MPESHAAALPHRMIGPQTASSAEIRLTFPRYPNSSLTPNMALITPQQIARFVISEVLSLRTTNGTPTPTTIRFRIGFVRRMCRYRLWLRIERLLNDGSWIRRIRSHVERYS